MRRVHYDRLVKGGAPRNGMRSAPDFIAGRFHDPDTFSHKDNDSGRFGKWPGIGRGDGGAGSMTAFSGSRRREGA